MAMISCHGNFLNDGRGTSECGKVASIEKALPWPLEKWWPQKYPWQGTCISHGNTRYRATSSHKHVYGSNILSGVITHMQINFSHIATRDKLLYQSRTRP